MPTRDHDRRLPEPLTLDDVYAAPGHLIRRLQQIAVAIFFDEFRGIPLTPVQYAALVAIRDCPGIDQKTLVGMIAIDRSTVGSVLKGLESKGLVRRVTPPDNLRIKQLYIEPEAEALLRSTRDTMVRVQERILAPLDRADRKTLLRLLADVVKINNDLSRAPLDAAEASVEPPSR